MTAVHGPGDGHPIRHRGVDPQESRDFVGGECSARRKAGTARSHNVWPGGTAPPRSRPRGQRRVQVGDDGFAEKSIGRRSLAARITSSIPAAASLPISRWMRVPSVAAGNRPLHIPPSLAAFPPARMAAAILMGSPVAVVCTMCPAESPGRDWRGVESPLRGQRPRKSGGGSRSRRLFSQTFLTRPITWR